MTLLVGEVIAVQGTKITLKIFDESSKEILFHDGEKYKGISIREYVSIQRGFRDVICVVEGEYLDERRFEIDGSQTYYIRKIEAKPIGYFDGETFYRGIKFLPMIKDSAYLLSEERILKIYSRSPADEFVIGTMLAEEIAISLPWQRLFNSHIGIFGNTGSGKSNTLAKLYTVLLDQKSDAIGEISKFVILDFNGEYTNSQLVGADRKTVLHLNTQQEQDKFSLSEGEFWDSETLGILFQATINTQRPFLNRIIEGRKKFAATPDSLLGYIRATFRTAFTAAEPKGEVLNLLRNISNIIAADAVTTLLNRINWNWTSKKFFVQVGAGKTYFEPDGQGYADFLGAAVDAITLVDISFFDELVIRANLKLITDLIYGAVQFDHIQPLIKRMDSAMPGLKKIVQVSAENDELRLVTVISLRKCNQEMKKVLPLLIAKHFYHHHKNDVGNPPDRTMHLIIDEAHNILSEQSFREHESWKDYRLELFEEIIKEGRKFGMYITLASQRPADISPTIVSQLHNFFIHRLVNDRDLFLLENTITTLDTLSRGMIPNLSQGACVVTGTSFELPMVLQIDKLPSGRQPDSLDVELESLWGAESAADTTQL